MNVQARLCADAPLQQSRAHAAALRLIGVDVTEPILPDGSRAVVMHRRIGPLRVAVLPRGPARADCAPATLAEYHAIRSALPRRTVLLVNAEHPPPAGLRHLPLLTGQWIAEWDLAPEPDRLRAALQGKWRNALRAAELRHLKVRETALPADPGHWLLRQTDQQARTRRYRHWPAALTAAYAAVAPGSARLFTAGSSTEPLAAMLFVTHGQRATYHLGWTSDTGRAANAHRLILWQAALSLRERGIGRLDLGMLDTVNAPGLARFKRGTGAQPRVLGPTLWVP